MISFAAYQLLRNLGVVRTSSPLPRRFLKKHLVLTFESRWTLGITQSIFAKCLGPLGQARNLVTERIFQFFDQGGDGIIDFEELACGLSVLVKGSHEEKLKHAFRGFDVENRGFLTRPDVRSMFTAHFLLSMELVRDTVRTMEDEMIANFDDDSDRPVSAAFTAPMPEGMQIAQDTQPKAQGDVAHDDDDIPGQYRLSVAGRRDQLEPMLTSMSESAIDELVEAVCLFS